MAETVYLVQVQGFTYNDEEYFANDSMVTIAVYRTQEAAQAWVASNGWGQIAHYLTGDLEWYDTDDEWANQRRARYATPEGKAEAVRNYFAVVPQPVG